MHRKITYVRFFLLTLFCSFNFIVIQTCMADTQVIQLTDNEYNNSMPQINEQGQVVWQAIVGIGYGGYSVGDIFFYDGNSTIRLTNDIYHDSDPQINNQGKIVWYGYGDDGNDADIFLYNGSGTIQLTDNSYGNYKPKINDQGQVVWRGDDGNDYEIFFYDGSRTIQLTENSYADWNPQINNHGQIAWSGNNNIFFHNGDSIINITNDLWSGGAPQLNDLGQIVWLGSKSSSDQEDVFFYDGESIIQLTNTVQQEHDIQINNQGQILWSSYDGTGVNNHEIYFYDSINTIQLTNNEFNDYHAIMNDLGQVVWSGYVTGIAGEIFLYSNGEITQLTDNGTELYPQMNNQGQIVWQHYDGNNNQIFLLKNLDSDNDGISDYADNCPALANADQVDSDDDGVGDLCDGCYLDPSKISPGVCGCGTLDTDTDGDGTFDCVDNCSSDSLKINPGICGCGIPDTDTDSDGTANCNDDCPLDPDRIEPDNEVCNGIDDDCNGSIDEGFTDSDSDGTADCIDECDSDPTKILVGQCGCGDPDTDTDNDGTADCIDSCPVDPFKINPGTCGCDINDSDIDLDGTPDCNDNCITDPLKTEPGICGCGALDSDINGDGVADCTTSYNAADYFYPLQNIGMKWVYNYITTKQIIIENVILENEGQELERFLAYYNLDDGIYRDDGWDTVIDLPDFSNLGEVKQYANGTEILTFQLLKVENIETIIGSFECIKVERTIVDENYYNHGYFWYAKNIGLIKFEGSFSVGPPIYLYSEYGSELTSLEIPGQCPADSDNDGTPDCLDECYYDPLKTSAGICGCGQEDIDIGDTDTDGTVDCLDRDDDNDGMPDDFENQHVGLNPLVDDAGADADADGIFNINEYNGGTDPTNPDTDDDGLYDGIEDANHNGALDPGESDPLDPDDPCAFEDYFVVNPMCTAIATSDTDRVVFFNSSQSLCYEMVSCVKEDRVCTDVWSFGGLGGVVGGNGHDIIVYQYDEAGDYTASLTMTEQDSGTFATEDLTVTAEIVETPLPAINFISTVDSAIVTLEIVDPDPSDIEVESIIVFWGDRYRKAETVSLPATIDHIYTRTGSEYHIRVKAILADGGVFNYTFMSDEDLMVSIP